MRTARFTDVVAAAGPPQVHSLWLKPDRDPALKRAVRDCRVMTIHQALRGSRKDYGSVGLHLEGSTQVLVFPKSLRRFGDRRIVGIDYGLIVQPDPKDPVPFEPPKRPVPSKASRETAGSLLAATSRIRSAPAVAKPKAGKQAPARQRTISEKTPPRPSPKPPPALKPAARTREELLGEIRRAVRELKAGKAVAAYERLNALV